jgi:hypothetical protein
MNSRFTRLTQFRLSRFSACALRLSERLQQMLLGEVREPPPDLVI